MSCLEVETNTSSGRCIATASIHVSTLIKVGKDKNLLSEH